MSSTKFVVEAWTCWAIAFIFIALRISLRASKLGWTQLKLDDGLMICALFAYAAEATSSYFLVARWLGYSNSGMTKAEREALDPNSLEWLYRVNGAKTHIWNWVTYISLMWLLKACWIAYYARFIAVTEKRPLRRITVGYVVLGLTYLSAILVVLCKCMPLKKQWQIYPDPGNACYPGDSTLQMAFVMSINTVTHMCIMAIPLPTILATKGMLPSQKIFLLVLFGGGFIVTVFGILRCVSILTATGTTTSSGQWSLRESFLAVLVTNLPIVAPLLKRFDYNVRNHSTKISSLTGTSPFNDSTDVELNDTKLHHNKLKSRSRKASLIPRINEGEEWDDIAIMVPKPTLGRRSTNSKNDDGTTEHAPTHIHTQNASQESILARLSGSALDLVPKKERCNMRTTVEAGFATHHRWNWSREERKNGDRKEDVEIEAGKIKVVQELRFTNSASGFYEGPVPGR